MFSVFQFLHICLIDESNHKSKNKNLANFNLCRCSMGFHSYHRGLQKCPWISWLALWSDMHFELWVLKRLCAFLNHVQSIAFATDGTTGDTFGMNWDADRMCTRSHGSEGKVRNKMNTVLSN